MSDQRTQVAGSEAASDFSLKLHQKMVREKQKIVKYVVRPAPANTENTTKIADVQTAAIFQEMDQTGAPREIQDNVKDEPAEVVEEDVDSLEEISESVKPKLYYCDKCDFSTEQEEDLKSHSSSAHKEVRYQCPKCDFKGIDKESTKEHYKASHEGALFACKQCEFRTRDKAEMYKHIKSNHK